MSRQLTQRAIVAAIMRVMGRRSGARTILNANRDMGAKQCCEYAQGARCIRFGGVRQRRARASRPKLQDHRQNSHPRDENRAKTSRPAQNAALACSRLMPSLLHQLPPLSYRSLCDASGFVKRRLYRGMRTGEDGPPRPDREFVREHGLKTICSRNRRLASSPASRSAAAPSIADATAGRDDATTVAVGTMIAGARVGLAGSSFGVGRAE